MAFANWRNVLQKKARIILQAFNWKNFWASGHKVNLVLEMSLWFLKGYLNSLLLFVPILSGKIVQRISNLLIFYWIVGFRLFQWIVDRILFRRLMFFVFQSSGTKIYLIRQHARASLPDFILSEITDGISRYTIVWYVESVSENWFFYIFQRKKKKRVVQRLGSSIKNQVKVTSESVSWFTKWTRGKSKELPSGRCYLNIFE